ncbi:MAG: short-chain dehydrogenase [Bacteroidetes bacterium]|nr:MAG: short-chain dehydrogenase [Bacteroidota bacterium]
MNLDLKGKHALIGGSSGGLGLASAIEISKLGADVTLLARNESKLRTALNQLDHSKGQNHQFLVADFSDRNSVANAVGKCLSNGRIVHILVNNTGGPKPGAAINSAPELFAQAFSEHLLNFQSITQSVLEGMKKDGFGRIVNIISTSVKEPIPGLGVSNTIRAAVAAWAKTLSRELAGFGITVNNVLPGYNRTARYDSLIESITQSSGKSAKEAEEDIKRNIPAGRIGEPEEFGAVVAFLCTPAASYVNGINLPVDGGRLSSL